MNKLLTKRKSDFLPKPVRGNSPLPTSWVRAIREALGMTTTQLAERLQMTQPAVVQLEKREADGGATIGNLKNAADALGCDLVYYFVPRKPLQKMIEEQAYRTAAETLARVSHSMKLEGQGTSPQVERKQIEMLAKELIRTQSRRIWDID